MLKYRPDIDGLRALAVVPVVLFHADVAPFSGGFVGVDIFFVISGYLITAMLLQDLAAGRFSILDFYVRRARRILPALLAVVAATLLAGFFLLLPDELEQAAKAARRIAVFASNHLFWHTQSDYWQQNTLANQPLLHTWSLAVEEQFYFIIPVLLLVCFKLKQHFGVLTALVMLSIASFSASQYWLSHQAAAAFYLLPSRAFELLVGAILAVILQQENKHSRLTNQWLGSIGLAAIGVSIFYYHDEMSFPGMAALLPCLGAATIIYAGASTHPGKASWVNQLLKMRAIVFVGLISYSLYLWHWPVLVLARSLGWYAWEWPETSTTVLVAGIFLLSWGSWRWIERPFRLKGKLALTISPPPPQKRQKSIAIFTTITALALCWGLGSGARFMVKHQPIPESMAEFARETSATPGARCEGNAETDAIRTGQGCILGDTTLVNTPAFIILGDSHARMWAEGLDTLGKEARQSILMMAYSSCTPILNYAPPTRRACATIIKEAVNAISRSPIKQVVLAGYWVDAMENMTRPEDSSPQPFQTWLEETVSILHNAGKSVYFLFDIPELQSESTLRQAFVQSLRTPDTVVTPITLASHEKRQAEITDAVTVLQDRCGIHFLYPDTHLCPKDMCLVAEHGRTLYRDKHHLTDAASRRFRKTFEPLLVSNL